MSDLPATMPCPSLRPQHPCQSLRPHWPPLGRGRWRCTSEARCIRLQILISLLSVSQTRSSTAYPSLRCCRVLCSICGSELCCDDQLQVAIPRKPLLRRCIPLRSAFTVLEVLVREAYTWSRHRDVAIANSMVSRWWSGESGGVKQRAERKMEFKECDGWCGKSRASSAATLN